MSTSKSTESAPRLSALRIILVARGPPRQARPGTNPPYHDFFERMNDAHDAQHGRDESFQREALPWMDDVYRFALSLTRDASDAEDVVQETFLRAYRSWHTLPVTQT